MSKVEIWAARGLGLQLVLLKPGGGPPYEIRKEFLLIPFGTVETDNGTFYFNENDAKEVLADRAGRPRVTFDYEHLAVRGKTADDMVSAGSFLLELRSDGLWAVDVQYTPKAEEQVRNGERIYFSPAWLSLKKTKHIVGILNVALTSTPAMKKLGTLIACSRFSHSKENEMAHQLGGHLQSYLKKSGMSSAQFAEKSGIHADRMSKLAEGEDPSEEEMKSCLKTMGIDKLDSDGDDDGDEGGEAKRTPPASPAKEETEQKNNSRGQGDDDVDLELLTGTNDPKKQNARLIAMAEKAKQFDEDHKKLETLSARENKRERERLVELGRKEGKLTPALERFYASRTNDELEEFLKHAPVALNVGAGARQVDPKSPAASLTIEEREVCKMTFSSPEKLAQFKADEKSGKNNELILASYQS
jgi:phage I-like protein